MHRSIEPTVQSFVSSIIWNKFLFSHRTKTSKNCSLTSPNSHRSTSGIHFPLPLPYILTYREIQLSGVIDRLQGTLPREVNP